MPAMPSGPPAVDGDKGNHQQMRQRQPDRAELREPRIVRIDDAARDGKMRHGVAVVEHRAVMPAPQHCSERERRAGGERPRDLRHGGEAASVKVRQLAEDVEALVDLLARELLQALGAEALAGKRAHHAAVEHGAAEGAGCELGLRCSSRRSRRQSCRLRRWDRRLLRAAVPGREMCVAPTFLGDLPKKAVAPYSPCLTTSMRGPRLEHGARGLHEVGVAGEHACLGVVDEQDVEALEHFKQRGLVVLDPVVHGVAGDELRVGHGFAHAALQDGIDVGEEEKFGIAIGVGNLGLEAGEDVELGLERLGLVEVFEIGALPEEAFAGGALDAARIDLVRVEDGLLLGAEVFADDGDDAHIGEVSWRRARSRLPRRRGSAPGVLREFQRCRTRRCRLR